VAGVFGGLALLSAMGLGLAIFPAPWGFLSAMGIVVFGGVFILMWIQMFPRSRAGTRITLRTDGATYKSAAPPPDDLVGADGESVTALRPGGIALIRGKRYDVLAEGGEWIATGAAIRVNDIRNGQVIVGNADASS